MRHDFGLFRIAEIQIIGDGQSARANGRQVAPCFCNGLRPTRMRMRFDIARRTVSAGGKAAAGTMYPDQPGIAARPGNGVCHDLTVILLIDPAPAAKIGTCQQAAQNSADRRIVGNAGTVQHRVWRAVCLRAVIFGCVIDQRGQRDVTRDTAILQQHQPAGFCHFANRHEIEVPFLENLPRRVRGVRLQHHQHAFLAFREHQLIGTHRFLTRRHQIKVHLHTQTAL